MLLNATGTRQVTRWLECEAQHNWLEAEFWAKYEFTRKVAAAILARGGDNGPARSCAEHLWAQHQAGRGSPEAAIQHIAEMSQSECEALFRGLEPTPVGPPMTPVGPTPGQRWPADDAGWPAAGPNHVSDAASSCNNSESFCPSRSDKTVEEHPAGAAMAPPGSHGEAATIGPPTDAAAIRACGLCGDAGVVTDAHLTGEDGDVAYIECQHYAAANIAEGRRIELESESYWTVKWTAQDIGTIVTDHGIMVTAQSRESYSALGNSE